MLRIGHGYDVHAFTSGDHLMLGGVRIPHHRGVCAHSDGDVVLHALCDALLGALALGDIGKFFPDSDPRWRGVDSRVFLRHVRQKLQAQGAEVNNVDITVVAQQPRLASHIDAMRACIATELEIAVSQISVKATTTEKLGFTGREEGISAYASVLLTESVVA